MKKILITGSEGFVGGHLISYLKDKYELIKFDIKISIFQDVRNRKYVLDFFREHKPDIVIHLAANPEVGTSFSYPGDDLHINACGTINVLEACKEIGVELFILASTAQVYGEPQYLEMDESHPIKPKSPYSTGKYTSEEYCRFYREKYNVPTVVFRFFNIFGENQPTTVVIPNLIRRISEAEDNSKFRMYGSKEDSRDFIYIKDICKAIEMAIEKKPVGETINLGTGKEVKILDLAKIIAEALNKNLDFVYDPIKEEDKNKLTRMCANVEKARNILGWEAETPLKEAIMNMVKDMGLI